MVISFGTVALALNPEAFWLNDDLNDVDYLLFVKGKEDPFTFKLDSIVPEQLLVHGFDPRKDTKLIAHGWVESGVDHSKRYSEGM